MKQVLLLLFSLVTCWSAHASEEPDLQSIILASKMTGVCGVMQ